jgi:NAD(P)-dependent dehydrogenase (short-subunit alcohol dehydrogenase family)
MSVRDKVVIVTGGASGIGLASVLLLGANGARVVIADRDGAAAEAAAGRVAAAGGTAAAVRIDIGDAAGVRAFVARVAQEHGRIDALVHCAGVCPRKPFLEMTDEDWRDIMRINLDGTFYITQAVARAMVPQRSGTMILVTSDRGLYGSVDYAHYAATKGGMIALTRSLAMILGRHGITVNGLNPGMTDTPLARSAIPSWEAKQALDVLGSYSRPEEIAEIVLFLAGTAGRFMTGQIVGNRMRLGM